MANFRAITAVCEAVIYTLQAEYPADEFNDEEMEFAVYVASDFAEPMLTGVSLFLYRVLPNTVHRTPTGRLAPNGRRYRTQLPLDLHFLLTVWAQDASLQHALAGWLMRVLEDTPIFPATLLNAITADTFQPDESVEITLDELRTEDLLHLWETLAQNVYQLSIPYIARNVRIDSRQLLAAGQPVQEREFRRAGA